MLFYDRDAGLASVEKYPWFSEHCEEQARFFLARLGSDVSTWVVTRFHLGGDNMGLAYLPII